MPVAWLKRRNHNYVPFLTVMVCARDSYKYLELFTNFLLLTDGPTVKGEHK